MKLAERVLPERFGGEELLITLLHTHKKVRVLEDMRGKPAKTRSLRVGKGPAKTDRAMRR